MADYSIDVKAKLNVQDVENTLSKENFQVKLVPHVDFDLNDSNVVTVKKKIDSYFERERTPLRFALFQEFLNQDVQEINKQIAKIDLDKINIKTNLESENFEQFKNDIKWINENLKDVKSKTFNIKFTAPTQNEIEQLQEKINNLKTSLENPFNINFNINEEDYNKLNEIIQSVYFLREEGIGTPVDIDINANEVEALENIATNIETIKSATSTPIGIEIQLPNKEEVQNISSILSTIKTSLNSVSNKKDGIQINVNSPSEDNIAKIKSTIEQYFVRNPIVLTLSQNTKGIEWESFNKQLEQFYKDQNIAFSNFLKEQSDAQKVAQQKEVEEAKQATIIKKAEEERATLEKKQQLEQQREDNKNTLEAQAQDILKYYDELKAKRKNNQIDEEKYINEIKQLVEKTENEKILIASNHQADLRKIRQDLYDSEQTLAKQQQEEERIRLEKQKQDNENYLQSQINNFKNLLDQEGKSLQEKLKEFDSSVNSFSLFNKDSVENFQQYIDQLSKIRANFLENTKTQWKTAVDNVFNEFLQNEDFKQFKKQFSELGAIGISNNIEGTLDYIKEVYNEALKYKKQLDGINQATEIWKQRIDEVFNAYVEKRITFDEVTDILKEFKLSGIFNSEEIKNSFTEVVNEITEIENNRINAQKQRQQEEIRLEQEKQEEKARIAQQGAEEEERIKLEAYKVLQNLDAKSQMDKRHALDEEKRHAKEHVDIANAFNKQELENSIKTQGEISANKKQNLLDLVEASKEASNNIVNIEKEANQKTSNILNDQQFLNDFERWETEIQKIVNHFGQFKTTLLEARDGLEKLKDEGLQSFDDDISQVVLKRYYEALNELTTAREKYVKEVEKTFKEQASLLVLSYKNNEKDFETFQKELKEKIEKAQKDGFVSEKTISETKKNLKQIEDAYNKSNQKIAENKEKENRDSIKKDLEDTQDLYNKKLISAEEYVSRMEQILPKAFEAGVDGAQKFQNSVDKVKKELQEANNKTVSFSDSLNKFGSSSNNLFNSLMRYFGITQIISSVTNSFTKMVTEVRNLDAELTEFKKVSDLTKEGLNKFIDDAYVLGGTVAKTGVEVVTATTAFKKMGYSVDESMSLAKNALMWTNVADGMVSVEESTNMLISTMKAFGLQAEDTTHIIDALNEVSNNYSTSSSALSNNLSTVAATMAASGVSLEQTIGLMTAGIEIMPDKASKVANGLKTISQRIRQIDGDTAEKLDEFLEKRGKSRFDPLTNQLKSTYDILGEVAEMWKDLSINEKQYFGEVMAGKNQITVLNALMTNFATAVNATETAINSENSALNENQRVMDSIQGHINEFKSAFSKLSKDIISSDAIKTVVDFGTAVIKWFDDVVNNHGPELISLLATIGTSIASMQLMKIGVNISSLITQLVAINPVLAGIVAAIGAVTYTATILTQKIENANGQIEDLKKKSYIDNDKETRSLEKIIKEYEELNEKRKNLAPGKEKDAVLARLAEIQTELQKSGHEVDIVHGKYEEQLDTLRKELEYQQLITLEEKKREHKENLNPVEETASQYKNIGDKTHGIAYWLFASDEQKIKDTSDMINSIVVQETNKIIETYENGEQIIKEIQGKSLNEILNNETLTSQEKIKILEQAILNYQKLASENREKAKNTADDFHKKTYEEQADTFDTIAGLIKTVRDNYKAETEDIEGIIDAAEAVVKTKLERMNVDLSKFSKEQLESLKNILDKAQIENIDIGELPEEFKALADIINDEELGRGLLNLVSAQYNKLIAQQFADIEESAGGLQSTLDSLSNSYSVAMNDILGILTSTTTSIQEQYDILAQAVDEFAENGVITKETLQSLTENDLLQYLEFVDGQLAINTDDFYNYQEAIIKNAAAEIDNKMQADLLKLANEKLKESLDNTKTSTENTTNKLDSAATSAGKTAGEFALLAVQSQNLGNKFLFMRKALGVEVNKDNFNMDEYVDEAQKIIDAATAAKDALGKFDYTANRGSSSSRSSSGSGGSSSRSSSSSSSSADREAQQAQREAEKALREAQQAFKDGFQSLYNELKTYLDLGAITEKEYYDSLEILVDKFYKDREGYEEEYWKYHDEIVKGRKKYLEKEMEDLFKKGETVLKRQLDAEVITYEEYFDSLEQLYKSYYTDKEDFENAMWELEKERYEHQIEEFDKQIKEYEDELSSLFKKGEKLLKHQLEMDELTQEEYLDQLEVLYRASITDQEELEDKLLEIKEERYKLEKKKQEEHLKELEKQLEEYYDEVKEMHDEYVKSLEDDAESIDAVISYAIDVLDDEISKLEEEKKALDEANSALEEQIKLQELEENLQKAKNRKIRVYRKGQGFVYEEDTKAVSEAQSAIDEYKKELAHKKEISMIDERIKQLQKYKEAWSNIPKEYKKAQNELLALQRAGSDAQKKILNGDQAFINEFVRQYNTTQDKLSEANKRNIDEINDFIFGTEEGAGLKQKIDQINAEIERVKSIEIKALIKGGEEGSSDSLEEIIDKIENLTSENGPIAKLNKKKIELQAEWKTVNGESQYNTIINNINNIQAELDKIKVKDLNITNWCNNIDSMIKKLQDLTTAANNASNAGIDVGNIGDGTYNPSGTNPSGGNGGTGWTAGAKVKINSEGKKNWPSNWAFKDNNYTVVEDDAYNPGNVRILVEGGTGGTVTHSVPASWLMGINDVENNNSSENTEVTETGRTPVYNYSGGQQTLVGYNVTYSDGSSIYMPAHASGTLGTTSKTFMINENGLEAMVTPEGTVISAPSTGYGVIKNEYTERLTDFASDPMGFLSKAFSGYSGTYKNNSSTNETININGNLTLPNVTNGESFVDSIRNLALQYTTRRK